MTNTTTPDQGKVRIRRRDWMQLIAALMAMPAPAQSPAQPAARVTREMVLNALGVIGLQFSDAQIEMLLPAANRSLTAYEALRAVDVPLDTPPAISFSPVLPGHPVKQGKSVWKAGKPPALIRFRNADELAFLPAVQLAAMIRAKRITSTTLTGMYLDRLRIYGPKLNCVITLTPELALEQAKKADADLRRGRRRSALHGVPYGAKDLFDTKGIPTTWGAEPYRNRVPDDDATVVERLRNAGAPLLGKLSMGALAQGGLWFGGLTRTPWNYELSSSGSSAGSGAATAAGLVGFSIGTETLGSIIAPSTRCAVAGVRPTFGRVSRQGAMALSWTMDKIGPMCRSVADCAEVLRIISGPDGRDLTTTSAPLTWDARRSVRSLKVGYLAAEFESLDPKLKPVYDAALDALRRAGVRLEAVTLPPFRLSSMLFLLDAEAAAAFDDLTRSGGLEQLSGQAPSDWPNQFRTSRLVPAVEYIRAQRARTIYMRLFADFMRQWDAFVSTTDSDSVGATNLTGHPQVVVPCGFSDGLPRGLLFTGRLFEEGVPMRLAFAYEQATDWHNRRPTLQS